MNRINIFGKSIELLNRIFKYFACYTIAILGLAYSERMSAVGLAINERIMQLAAMELGSYLSSTVNYLHKWFPSYREMAIFD